MSGKDRKRRLSQDERTLWSEFTRKIAPLPQRPSPADADEPEAEAKPAARAKPPAAAAKAITKPAAKKSPPPPELAPLARRDKQRIARGKEKIGARLDLHGHTQAEAHAELSHFLHGALARDKRLVLVITGKSGVLRRQVPLWLNLPEFRDLVVGFETAAISHGGEGALYVRVRKSKA